VVVSFKSGRERTLLKAAVRWERKKEKKSNGASHLWSDEYLFQETEGEFTFLVSKGKKKKRKKK